MCAYVCVCVCVYVHMSVCGWMDGCMCMCAYVCMRVCEYVSMCVMTKAYRKSLEARRDKLARLVNNKYSGDTDPLDPGQLAQCACVYVYVCV